MYIIGKRLEKETVKKMMVYIELTTCDATITVFDELLLYQIKIAV